MALDIRALRSSAPFWSVRYHEEQRETLAMRQDTLEPPRLSVDRGELRQRFHFTVPHMRVAANQGKDTQVRSLDHAQQGGFEQVERGGFIGSGGRLAEEAIQLLMAPNCPSGQMDLVLLPDQVMLQVHESIGHPLELDRIPGDGRNYAGTSFVTPG